MTTARSGGQILVDSLQKQGAEIVFGVPGESYLAVLDALHDSPIRFITNRQEGGAAFMAEAYGKLTGQPGICFVTRGPGATNASIGVHTAQQDSTPMILFIGQVGNDFVEREAFQEIDYRRMFGQMSKWVAQIDRADRIPEYVARAFQVATSGRPGPVVLALPEDMLTDRAIVADAARYQPVQAAPSAPQIARVRELLSQAQRPIVILGGATWTSAACDDMQRFVHANGLPVTCAFRFQDVFDNADPHYVGDVGIGINPALARRIEQADLILAIGPRLGEMTTGGYALLQAPRPRQRLIHIHTGAEELGRVYQADLMINSGMAECATALAAMAPLDQLPWRDSVTEARQAYLAWQERPAQMDAQGVQLDLWQVMQTLRAELPANTVLTNGAGNFASWAHRFWRYGNRSKGLRTQLAPTSGAMGYGVPAGIAAALHGQLCDQPRTVLTVAGDGDFMMNGQELATAVQYGAKMLLIIFNNNMFGTIRMHQERHYPARVSGTALQNPDFCALARAYGAFGEMVDSTDQFGPSLQRALTHIAEQNGPAVIELRYDGNLITPNTTLAAIRLAAQQASVGTST
ncbi:MAG: thiamine pyrophosphate-binding protein [Pseudomonadota bacterium]|nr:thiamine pyrophosphate-binding protein [Pseudomonadota bacterium]